MLQKLNERLTGVIAWVIIVLIALTLTLLSVDYYRQNHRPSTVQMEVNGIPLSKQRFDLNLHRAHQNTNVPVTPKNEKFLVETVQEGMVVNEVSLQAAKKNGFDVMDVQANDAIYNIPQFQEQGHFSAQRYEQLINKALFTPHTFQEEVRQGMLLNQQRFAFIGTAFALPNESSYFVKLLMQSRDYDYVFIPATPFVAKDKISEEQVKAYYEQHRKDFITPEQVSLEYLQLSLGHLRENTVITDAEAQHYYDENQANFLEPAQWKVAHLLFAFPSEASKAQKAQVKEEARRIYQQLEKEPAQFDALLKTSSTIQVNDAHTNTHHEDMSAPKNESASPEGKLIDSNKTTDSTLITSQPTVLNSVDRSDTASPENISNPEGGILPWIVAGQSHFDKSLVTLTEPGQISKPIKSKQGYEIFKLLKYKPAKAKPFQDVKETIKKQLQTELSQVKYAQAVEQFGDLSYQYPDSLQPIAESLGLPIQYSELISRNGGNASNKLAKNPQVIKTAFSRDVLELRNNSEPIQLDEQTVVVFRIAKHLSAKEKSLDEVKPSILEKLALIEGQKQAQLLGEALINAQADKVRQEHLMHEHKIEWIVVKGATREADKAPSEVNNLAFSLTKLNQCEGHKLNKKDYLLICLRNITPGQFKSLDKEQQASLAQQIESNEGQMNYELYIKHLLTTAKIVRH